MTLRLTDRDTRLLVKCALCRWLSTSQIQRLYFPDATVNAVQKRLRKLTDDCYLRSHRENQMAEAIYAVGPKGKPLVEGKGTEVAAGNDVPKQFDHLAGVNAIRIALETNSLPLAYFFAYWQLASVGWTFPVIPDAVFAIKSPDRQRYLVEYDRGTEPLKALVEKLRSYNQGIPGFAADAVLLVLEENRRLDQLGRELRKEGIQIPCLAAGLAEVERTLAEPVFVDLLDGTRRALLAS
jgi:Replication-relaxation